MVQSTDYKQPTTTDKEVDVPLSTTPSVLSLPMTKSSFSTSQEASFSSALPGASCSLPAESVRSLLCNKLMSLSNRLGLPTEAIKGIANKAADILQEDGAITNAPGHPGSAKMVISHSGKRPHLVLPKKKSGGL